MTARLREKSMAKQKQTIQSTTYNNNYASRAVDGVVDPANPSCTLNGVHSWWAVDLLQRFLVRKVIVSTDSNVGMGNLYIIRTKFVCGQRASVCIDSACCCYPGRLFTGPDRYWLRARNVRARRQRGAGLCSDRTRRLASRLAGRGLNFRRPS